MQLIVRDNARASRLLLTILYLTSAAIGFAHLESIVAFAQAPAKLWSLDLDRDEDFKKRSANNEVLLTAPHISFLNSDQILVDFYADAEIGFNPSLRHAPYHVLEVDARSAAFRRKLTFQAVDDHSRTLPVSDGGFVVLAGGQLTKFNSDFASRAQIPTKITNINGRPDLWLMDVSPSGGTVVLYHHIVGNDQADWSWLRSSDLSISHTLKSDLALNILAGDSTAILDTGGDRSLLDSGTIKELCKICDVYDMKDDLLFVQSGIDKTRNRYSIQTIDHKVVATGSLDTHAADFARAVTSTRVAYLSGHYEGSGFPIKSNFHALAARIKILDWSTNKTVAEIEENESVQSTSAGLAQSALALSPDGRYLAILLHHTLICYKLP